MNTRTNKTVLLIILMICLATAVYSAVGTFTFRTSGASDTTEVVDLRYPQKVPEDASVTTDSIADDSITNDKLAEPVSVANGGTGKTTAAEALAALGGASLNGSSTVAFNASTINGVAPLTAAEKTQALVGSSTVDFLARNLALSGTMTNSGFTTFGSSTNINSGAVLSVGGYTFGAKDSGTIYVVDRSENQHAKFYYHNGNTTVEEQDPSSDFSPTAGNAGTINVYFVDGVLSIQNNDGALRSVKYYVSGFDE